MAATPMDILSGLEAKSLGDEVRKMDPVDSVVHDRVQSGPPLPVGDSRWHEHQWVGMTWIPAVAPQVHMDAMTGVEVVEVAGGQDFGCL